MKTNIIKSIINLVDNPVVNLKEYKKSGNRANQMGDALEEYVKDIFAGTILETDMSKRNRAISECFSYLGNINNPPDSILKNGDAIEVKKLEGKNAAISLNSSYPKAKLYSNSPMITESCRNCEQWEEKDILYSIGVVTKSEILTHLTMIYGIDYAASESTYSRIQKIISDEIYSIENVEFAQTKELGRINRIDPLGITKFRIRGMWTIENPLKVFNYVNNNNNNSNSDFKFMAIINNDKYYSLDYIDELEEKAKKISNLNIEDIEIKVPDNPANLKKAKLITFYK